MNRGQEVAIAIEKELADNSLLDWAEENGITQEEYEAEMQADYEAEMQRLQPELYQV